MKREDIDDLAQSDVNETKHALGKRLRVYRRRTGLTQRALAESVGISQQQIQKYETGRDRLPADRLRLLCEALGIAPSTIYSALDELAPNKGPPAETATAIAVPAPDAQQLIQAFQRIPDPGVRQRVLELIRALGAEPALP